MLRRSVMKPALPHDEFSHRAHAAWSLFEARLVAEALHSEDIESTIRNDTLVGSIGLLPAGEVKVEVWVRKDDIERAETIVQKVLYSDAQQPVVGHSSTSDA